MQRIEVRLEDDLTGGPADETVQFALDGRGYEVDLTARHAAELRRQLAPFVERARQVPARRSRHRTRTTASRERSQEIRTWAEQHGFAISERGRLPGNVIQEFELEHRGEQSGEQGSRRLAARGNAGAKRASTRTPAKSSRPRRTSHARGRGK